MALEESQSTFDFAEVEGDELRIRPFLGEVDATRELPFVQSIDNSWLDGSYEIVIHGAAVTEIESARFIDECLEIAREHWCRTAVPSSPSEPPEVDAPSMMPGAVEVVTDSTAPGAEAAPVAETVTVARLRADISPEWSWASANARIPQIGDVVVELGEAAEQARISVTLRDADIVFGSKVVHDGAMSAGPSEFGTVHVPLSTRVMSQVDERLGATCEIVLEVDGTVVARIDEAVDLQPRDHWNLDGDAKNGGR